MSFDVGTWHRLVAPSSIAEWIAQNGSLDWEAFHMKPLRLSKVRAFSLLHFTHPNGDYAFTGEAHWDYDEIEPVIETKNAQNKVLPLVRGLDYRIYKPDSNWHGQVGELVGLASPKNPYDPYACQLSIPGEGPYWFYANQLQGAWEAPIVAIPKCTCELSRGCSCGVFEAEQRALGRIYDPILRYWRKPRG